MRPILLTIPPLPAAWLLPLVLAVFGIGLMAARRAKSVFPLLAAAGAAVLGLLWSRLEHGIPLHSYGLFLVIGFFISTYLACLEARRRGYDPNVVLDAAMPLLLVSIALCRVLYFLVYPDQWSGIGGFLQIWNGGLSFHGAIVGGLGTLAYFAWKNKIPFGTMADFVAPGVFLGYAVGRVGCFMNGCCYGFATDLPWAVRFHVEGSSDPLALTPPCHPAQLYSTGMGILLFGVMWSLRKKPNLNRFPGQITLLFLAFYALERAVMEYFRNGATAPRLIPGVDWLTRAQFASIVGLVVIAALWLVLSRRALSYSSQDPRPKTQDPTHVPAG